MAFVLGTVCHSSILMTHIGCGIGVLLRMFWIFAVVMIRIVRGGRTSFQYTPVAVSAEDLMAPPPTYAFEDVKIPLLLRMLRLRLLLRTLRRLLRNPSRRGRLRYGLEIQFFPSFPSSTCPNSPALPSAPSVSSGSSVPSSLTLLPLLLTHDPVSLSGSLVKPIFEHLTCVE